MFGRDMVHTVTNQEQMTQFALPTLYKMNKAEVQRWKDDKSGTRGQNPDSWHREHSNSK